jgi:outer membrane protein assembly factor BamB
MMNNSITRVLLSLVLIGANIPFTLAQTPTPTETTPSPTDVTPTPTPTLAPTDVTPTPTETIPSPTDQTTTPTFDFLSKLTADDSQAGDLFGYKVALSGNYALVSAAFTDNKALFDNGTAYLFELTSRQLNKKITVSNQISVDIQRSKDKDKIANNLFGYSIAVSDNYAVIGAPKNDRKDIDTGAVYLLDLTTGEQKQEFIPDDPEVGNLFGQAVATDGKYVVIGSPYSDRKDLEPNSEEKKEDKKESQQKGIDRGVVYLFDLTTGAQMQKLMAEDSLDGDLFGSAVSIYGNYAVISSPYHDRKGTDSGAVYAFDLTTGKQVQKFTADDGQAGDVFGNAVVIQGNYVLIGSANSDIVPKDPNKANSGSVYLFDLTTGKQIQKFVPDDIAAGDLCGYSLAMSDRYILLGCPYKDPKNTQPETTKEENKEQMPFDTGAAYLFDITTGKQIHKFVADDRQAGDVFGFSVAMSDRYVLIGATYDDEGDKFDRGSAYLFDLSTGEQIEKF